MSKSTLKFIWKQNITTSQSNLEQKEQCWRCHNTQLQTIYCRAKAAQCWYKNRQENQWNRIENPEINPHSYSQLIFDKEVKNIHWRKPLQQMLLEKLVICM
jgi:hypothetical protein